MELFQEKLPLFRDGPEVMVFTKGKHTSPNDSGPASV